MCIAVPWHGIARNLRRVTVDTEDLLQ